MRSSVCLHDTPTTETYTLSLHDALPIWRRAAEPRRRRAPGDRVVHPLARGAGEGEDRAVRGRQGGLYLEPAERDRKSTRLNSSHVEISYAVFCLKKKTTTSPSSHS